MSCCSSHAEPGIVSGESPGAITGTDIVCRYITGAIEFLGHQQRPRDTPGLSDR